MNTREVLTQTVNRCIREGSPVIVEAIVGKPAKRQNLAQYLRKRSREICRDNGCKDGNHNCESYAYITADYRLLDICASDYFQGSSKPHAAIPLPFRGTMTELKKMVDADCFDMAD